MQRRHLLRLTASTLAAASSAGLVSADGGADPRPEAQAGTRPNKNVPTTETGAIGTEPFNEASEIPVGNWIYYANGWVLPGSKDRVELFANSTTQTYTIDQEVFILDDFEDWDHWEDSNGDHHLSFEYYSPPKPKGTTYEVTWEFEWNSEPLEGHPNWENSFPFSNQIEIVGRNATR